MLAGCSTANKKQLISCLGGDHAAADSNRLLLELPARFSLLNSSHDSTAFVRLVWQFFMNATINSSGMGSGIPFASHFSNPGAAASVLSGSPWDAILPVQMELHFFMAFISQIARAWRLIFSPPR
ncbi:MAG: hypothetical protein NTX50_18695 [Candidatus Sumerlaeota bacterium]|nr:hypothetical protein [Candidatus Sumerlaeota bacterium]